MEFEEEQKENEWKRATASGRDPEQLVLRVPGRGVLLVALGVGVGVLAVAGCKKSDDQAERKLAPSALQTGKLGVQEEASDAPVTIPDGMLGMFKPPLPEVFESADNPLTPEKVELGRMLYFDTRFSKNHDLSCNSCHLLDKYGVDGKKVSTGHKAQQGTRNSPTVYNAAGHFAQFWDGRSPSIEHQATQPVTNPVEMAMAGEAAVVVVLKSIPTYVDAFKKVFPEEAEPVTMTNFGKAVGAFERKLTTRAPWDAFLEGRADALTDEQKRGFLAFMNNGCAACHLGTLVGGTTFQKVGAVKPWPNQADKGRFEVTQNKTDEMMFKTPSLRNVAKTAPYFHDGSVDSLETAVKMMGEYQLGRDLPQSEVKAIVAWLDSLTGELPSDAIAQPEVPPSGPTTPKPDPN